MAGLSKALSDLATALARPVETAPDPARAERAEQLRRHVAGYVAPRAADLSAPLVVVLLRSTGVGKSSLFNAIAGGPLSESGLIRPTTRRPVALVHPADDPNVRQDGSLAGISARDQLDVRADPAIAPGLMIVDAPDFDSVERSNRELAVQLRGNRAIRGRTARRPARRQREARPVSTRENVPTHVSILAHRRWVVRLRGNPSRRRGLDTWTVVHKVASRVDRPCRCGLGGMSRGGLSACLVWPLCRRPLV